MDLLFAMDTSVSSGHNSECEDVPARIIWWNEAHAFTRWLAANLVSLSNAIDVPLALLSSKAVGATRFVDLLAHDERDGSIVVIENQLEPANDAHLGQILTYVAAVDARAVVWIATRFAAPHLSAIRWLNGIAGQPLRFYAVALRVVQAGASSPTVIFDVLERPRRSEPPSPAPPPQARIEVGGFATAFWTAHMRRFPDEARLSRAVGERCRWRSTQPAGVVIAQFAQDAGVSVFLRGRDGVTLDAVDGLLAPFADGFERRLGVPVHGARSGTLAESRLEIDLRRPENWGEASMWLRSRTESYDEALRAMVRESVNLTHDSLAAASSTTATAAGRHKFRGRRAAKVHAGRSEE
jgi:hypothetical protein